MIHCHQKTIHFQIKCKSLKTLKILYLFNCSTFKDITNNDSIHPNIYRFYNKKYFSSVGFRPFIYLDSSNINHVTIGYELFWHLDQNWLLTLQTFSIKTNKWNTLQWRKIKIDKRSDNNVVKMHWLSFAYHELDLHSERSCWGAEVDVIIVEACL